MRKMPEVALYLDGKLVERKTGNRSFVFSIAISGQHTIVVKSGMYSDQIMIHKVETANPEYSFGNTGEVINWFDNEDIDPTCFSIKDTLGAFLAHPDTQPIVGAMMEKAAASRGDVAKSANSNPNLQKMMAGMSLQSLLKQAGDTIPPETVRQLNTALQQIKK